MTALAETIAAALKGAAHACDGACGLTEDACRQAHPISWAGTARQGHADEVTWIEGTTIAIAEACAAVRDAELDRLRAEIAAQVRSIAEDGPVGFCNLRRFIARHDRLLTGHSVVAVLLALADEIETPGRATYPKDITRAD